ncbi:hypothetical protein [Colwellia psychrerythraea]|uniref:Uncharacterized protein n=1 Tax=Colwellia psychrerythraea TaxID=28229 RepID=A0A099KFD3_COLPS|nr:hypothetical protein [Colwellia psychrerythraea]KGJ89000.1 hypothetical protein GAB14E_3996 [Colwellia psychrerythraea]
MTMKIASSTDNFMNVQPVMSSKPHGEPRSDLNDILTPEQKNTVLQGVDDKIAEQVDNVKSNYQTAKDIDLMQSYYQQQQKLFDIYLQTSIDSNVENSSTPSNKNTSAVSSLTNTYAELYQLHQNIKEGVVQLPGFEVPAKDVNILPVTQVNQAVVSPSNSANQASSHKQMGAYNSLMMPSTASYVHLSA